ncbi:hypothetical protein FSP39_013745 [Pinctada imbricata]|uniref:Thyroglobulin type-1 domain-containing protein n=1 Tax=Pinctada imbricata TaxID=66713 RepID=A0AA88XG40_PINIB|nr:hypothetical protein FSP39_013745 [Pinctada imbricata]
MYRVGTRRIIHKVSCLAKDDKLIFVSLCLTVCVRAKYEARGRRGAVFNCDPVTGNYKPKQCRGSVCFCSDPEGNQVGKDVPRNKELTC